MNNIGDVDIVSVPTLTKGTQGTTGFAVQNYKDAGRNQTNYFMVAPVQLTAAEVMQSLTGYKGGIAVATTVSPAVVTAAKVYRINRITITVFASAAIGSVRVNLRANLSGLGVIGSPLVCNWQCGLPGAFVASAGQSYDFNYPDGLEFAAGTGIAIGAQGFGAPTTGAANCFVKVEIQGFEY